MQPRHRRLSIAGIATTLLLGVLALVAPTLVPPASAAPGPLPSSGIGVGVNGFLRVGTPGTTRLPILHPARPSQCSDGISNETGDIYLAWNSTRTANDLSVDANDPQCKPNGSGGTPGTLTNWGAFGTASVTGGSGTYDARWDSEANGNNGRCWARQFNTSNNPFNNCRNNTSPANPVAANQQGVMVYPYNSYWPYPIQRRNVQLPFTVSGGNITVDPTNPSVSFPQGFSLQGTGAPAASPAPAIFANLFVLQGLQLLKFNTTDGVAPNVSTPPGSTQRGTRCVDAGATPFGNNWYGTTDSAGNVSLKGCALVYATLKKAIFDVPNSVSLLVTINVGLAEDIVCKTNAFPVTFTTGTSGSLTGAPYDTTTKRLRLVAEGFSISELFATNGTGGGTPPGNDTTPAGICKTASVAVGLPVPSGGGEPNQVSIDLYEGSAEPAGCTAIPFAPANWSATSAPLASNCFVPFGTVPPNSNEGSVQTLTIVDPAGRGGACQTASTVTGPVAINSSQIVMPRRDLSPITLGGTRPSGCTVDIDGPPTSPGPPPVLPNVPDNRPLTGSIASQNVAPTMTGGGTYLVSGNATGFQLPGGSTDAVGGGTRTYTWSGPTGTCTGIGLSSTTVPRPTLTGVPNINCTATFTATVSDGFATSSPATFTVIVRPATIGTISGTVTNGGGTPGVVTVNLYRQSTGFVASTTVPTLPGSFSFSGLTPATDYIVEYVAATGTRTFYGATNALVPAKTARLIPQTFSTADAMVYGTGVAATIVAPTNSLKRGDGTTNISGGTARFYDAGGFICQVNVVSAGFSSCPLNPGTAYTILVTPSDAGVRPMFYNGQANGSVLGGRGALAVTAVAPTTTLISNWRFPNSAFTPANSQSPGSIALNVNRPGTGDVEVRIYDLNTGAFVASKRTGTGGSPVAVNFDSWTTASNDPTNPVTVAGIPAGSYVVWIWGRGLNGVSQPLCSQWVAGVGTSLRGGPNDGTEKIVSTAAVVVAGATLNLGTITMTEQAGCS